MNVREHSAFQPGAGRGESSGPGELAVARLQAASTGMVVALCCVSYANSMGNEFSFDDNFAVVKNADVTSEVSIWDIARHDYWGRDITTPLSHKSWRPLTTLTFRWNFWVGGLEPASYHAANIAAHVAVTLLLYAS